MGRKKYHVESAQGMMTRLTDRDDCEGYSDCLMEAALANKAKKLPCEGCRRYKRTESRVSAWQRRKDETLW